MSLIKRFKFGVIENIFDKIVNILFRFLEPILFINFLGVSYYGEWLIIFAIPAAAPAIPPKPNTAAIKAITKNVIVQRNIVFSLVIKFVRK